MGYGEIDPNQTKQRRYSVVVVVSIESDSLLLNLNWNDTSLARWNSSLLRNAVAVVCMALAAMLSAQGYIRLMDRIEHAHNHAHFANPLAGSVTLSSDHGAKDHHHRRGETANSSDHSHVAQTTDGHPHSHDSGSHHHTQGQNDHQHGDATVLFLAAQSFVLAGCPVTFLRCDVRPQSFVSFAPRGPDHPPKPAAVFRV
jgi:hypothetical protein